MTFWEYLDTHPGTTVAILAFIGLVLGILGKRLVEKRPCTHRACVLMHEAHQILPKGSEAEEYFIFAVHKAMEDASSMALGKKEGA